MAVYDTIVNEKILSESVMDVLFGDISVTDRKRLLFSSNLALMSKKVCMLYTALIQIYISGKAIYSSGESLSSVSPVAMNSIKHCWEVDGNFDLANNKTVFSFLSAWASANEKEVFSPSASQAIARIIPPCEKLGGNNRYEDPDIEDKFLSLVRSMPLLAKAEFDFKKRKIRLTDTGFNADMEYSPFIEFWDSQKKCLTKAQTDYPMILTSVGKGHSNNELSFNYVYLGKYYKSDNKQTINKSVNNNEWVRLICEHFDVKTEWYPVKQCWGDFTFLKHVTDITYAVFTQNWNCTRRKDENTDVFDKLREMFSGSEIYNSFTPQRVLPRKALHNNLYGLFIKFGVFKTFKSIFFEQNNSADKSRLFEDFLECIKSKNLATESEINLSRDECNETIRFHVSKLKKFLAPETPTYKKRSREIKAEWHAFTVLKLTGMCTEKLFADMENIYSIDDYFEMIKNPNSSLYEDLTEAMRFLVEFYDSLEKDYLSNPDGYVYDEMRYQALVLKKRAEIASADLGSLFEEFIDIVKRTDGSAMVSDMLSRNYICNLQLLMEYKDEIFDDIKLSESRSELEFEEAKYVFISYKHEEDNHTPGYIERINNSYVNCIVDDNYLQGGENWKKWVRDAIRNPLCEAVYVFLNKKAVISEAIKYELSVAYDEARKRKKKDPNFNIDKFIVLVNLETTDPADYIDEAADIAGNDFAMAIRECLIPQSSPCMSDKKFYKWPAETETVIHELSKRVPLPDDAGYVVRKNYSSSELHIANFYGFLKYGDDYIDKSEDEIDAYFKNPSSSLCVFPMVVSVKETQIKRDNITLVGYEIISGSCSDGSENSYILTSFKLRADEYYCIPNHRTAEDCSWMIEPFLVSQDIFVGKDIKD